MDRYLPVGTVCTLNTTNRKYVIAGYFSLEYNSDIKMYDYVGVPYPEGLLLQSKMLSFNHSDIVDIDFLGYMDDDFKNFNSKICEQSNEVDEMEEDSGLLNNFKFDENGVIIYDYTIDALGENSINYNSSYGVENEEEIENPFNQIVDYSDHDSVKDDEEWTVFKTYEFDENGTLVSEENVEIPNENEEDTEYEFDEDGNVVVDTTE